jgi:predicted transglutaminase-like cysteine proteinase
MPLLRKVNRAVNQRVVSTEDRSASGNAWTLPAGGRVSRA